LKIRRDTMATRSAVREFKGYPAIKIFIGWEYKGKKEYITPRVRKAAALCHEIDEIGTSVDQEEFCKK